MRSGPETGGWFSPQGRQGLPPDWLPPDDLLGYPPAPPPREPNRLRLHIFLFLATLATTVLTGAALSRQSLEDPFRWQNGIPFALSLLAILGVHEMGHYVVAKRHGLRVTLPFFIPAPPPPYGLIGTMGAVIKIKSPISRRAALLDIGVAGPLSGFAVALPVTAVGLALSSAATAVPPEGGFTLGSSLLFQLLIALFAPPGAQEHLLLHPIAYAGWVGLLVTAFNLLPIGQLDGGHIARALLGPRHDRIALAFLVLLIPLGAFFWIGWLIWALLLVIIGWRHRPPADEYLPLSRRRWFLGLAAMLIFILTFTPVPFAVNMP